MDVEYLRTGVGTASYYGGPDGRLVAGGDWCLESGGELVTDAKGLATGRLTFKGKPGAWATMPRVGATHPLAVFCAMEKRTVKFEKGWWVVTGEYAGTQNVDPAESGDSSDSSDSSSSDSSSSEGDGGTWEYPSPPEYGLNPGTGTERIELHPDFVTKFGGTAASPKNGAIFRDASGNETSDADVAVFDRFKISVGGVKNPFAGLEEYLTIAGTTWTKSWTTSSRPGGSRGAVIVENPPGNPPSFGSSHNWLEMPPSYSKRGRAYACQQVWMLSGPAGWNTTIYG